MSKQRLSNLLGLKADLLSILRMTLSVFTGFDYQQIYRKSIGNKPLRKLISMFAKLGLTVKNPKLACVLAAYYIAAILFIH